MTQTKCRRLSMDIGLRGRLPDLLPRLWTFAMRLSGNPDDAEVLVEQACLRGLEREHQTKTGSSLITWMFSIVHTTWINEIRTCDRGGAPRSDWNADMVQVTDPVASDPAARASALRIIAAVARLPEAERTAMILVTVEGLSYDEAAEVLGISTATVVNRLLQGRQSVAVSFDHLTCR